MAEIRIEEKKKSSVLPWILGLLLLGLLIWGAAELFDESDELEAENIEEVDEVAVPAAAVAAEVDYGYRNAINKYAEYTTEMTGEMGLDHEFSHNALTYLATAVEAIAEGRNVDLTNNTGRAKQLADEITKDPYATDHADKIRMAAINLTESLERIDREAYNNAAMEDLKMLRKEAQDITAKTLTLNQKEDVRTFFGAARKVLMKMN